MPVPVHAERARERGFDQAELLASAAGALLGMGLAFLMTSRPSPAQSAALTTFSPTPLIAPSPKRISRLPFEVPTTVKRTPVARDHSSRDPVVIGMTSRAVSGQKKKQKKCQIKKKEKKCYFSIKI